MRPNHNKLHFESSGLGKALTGLKVKEAKHLPSWRWKVATRIWQASVGEHHQPQQHFELSDRGKALTFFKVKGGHQDLTGITVNEDHQPQQHFESFWILHQAAYRINRSNSRKDGCNENDESEGEIHYCYNRKKFWKCENCGKIAWHFVLQDFYVICLHDAPIVVVVACVRIFWGSRAALLDKSCIEQNVAGLMQFSIYKSNKFRAGWHSQKFGRGYPDVASQFYMTSCTNVTY